jgi:hypothetical protein
MFVFFIQLILFLLFLITVSDSFKFEDGFFVMIAFDVSIARFCNVLLMHFLSEPEIRQAL